MDLVDYFRRQFAYNAWANREVVAVIRASGDPAPRLLALMGHIVSAEGLWLQRLKHEPQTFPVWPEFDVARCVAQAEDLARLWREYLSAVSQETLANKVSYKNSKGEAWSDTIQDVLTHALMHSAYHRGQIASFMRANGQAPAYTDFIHAVRQGLVE